MYLVHAGFEASIFKGVLHMPSDSYDEGLFAPRHSLLNVFSYQPSTIDSVHYRHTEVCEKNSVSNSHLVALLDIV